MGEGIREEVGEGIRKNSQITERWWPGGKALIQKSERFFFFALGRCLKVYITFLLRGISGGI